MKNKYILSAILVLFVLSVFGYISMANLGGSTNNISDTALSDSPEYHSEVVVRKNGEVIDRSSNLVTNDGLDLVKDAIGDDGSGGPVDYIGLCNATAGCAEPDASDTDLENEITDCGLERTEGSYDSEGTGNWSIENTYTSTCDDTSTNKTGIFNAETDGTLFAENSFTDVTLQTDDQLTIDWNIWVE